MDPFIGEIRAFGFTFVPQGWALCNGQLLSISQNTALYSILGVNFGGDGRTTFALPNLQGNIVVDAGQGTGLSNYTVGQAGGAASVTLAANQVGHTHQMQAATASGTTSDPTNAILAQGVVKGSRTAIPFYQSAAPATAMSTGALGAVGGGQPHPNQMPFLVMIYCIAMQGIYPSRP